MLKDEATATVVIHDENRGALAAKYMGIAISSGEYVGLFNSDNQLLPGFFYQTHRTLEEWSGIGLLARKTEVWISSEDHRGSTYRFDLEP